MKFHLIIIQLTFLKLSESMSLRRVADVMAIASECMFSMQVNPILIKKLSNGNTSNVDEKTQVSTFSFRSFELI